MKKIITIIIVVAALAGAGFLGYSAMHKSTSTGSGKSGDIAKTILPYGSDLNFKPIQDFNNTGRFFPYPKVTPPEIGSTTTALVP